MTSLSRTAIFGVLAAVAAAIAILAVLAGEDVRPAGDTVSKSGEARADRLFARLRQSPQFRADGGTVTWDSATALGAEGVLIRNLRIARTGANGRAGGIAAAELRVRRLDWSNLAVPARGDIAVAGLKSLDPAGLRGLPAFMAASGARDPVADARLRWTYRQDDRTMDIGIAELTVREWGTVRFAGRILELDMKALLEMESGEEADPVQAFGLLAGAKIGALSLSFRDRGAIDRMAAQRAGDTGQDKAAVIAQAVKGLEARRAAAPHAILRQALDAAIVLVKNRGAITLTAAPQPPVALLTLVLLLRRDDPDRLARKLGVTVAAE